MPFDSVLGAVAAVEDLSSRVTVLAAVVAPNDAENLQAGLDGVRTDALAFLTEFDATQEEDLLVVDDGALTIAMWRWRRGTRKAVNALLGQARATQDVAAQRQRGRDERVVVSRERDTLQRIAARELGSWREWPRLLAANPSLGAGELPSGTTLVIPERR